MNKFFSWFGPAALLYPFRWLIAVGGILLACMSYADYTGWRIFTGGGSPQQHGYYSNGTYYHK